ncbi:TrbC/VIRB2 family protein [Caballeronia terrestris]|jgi:type IV secretion system protein VirB2|uniref:TrbC/VIRB2 family protein n=1 Tax=Caballeronia terrestris TaxID=1226301 RepID=A0A158K2P6_9BURK|nr:TrbC/VirB2 family protein [Caballeronia terrestris]SAL75398.1 TrbC/VIRB2 family protein [Caballeronia terrestris]
MGQLNDHKELTVGPCKGDSVDRVLEFIANALVLLLILLPEIAQAQDAAGAFTGITAFLKSITNLLIFEWGYYIGIITLAIQGIRWKTGRIDLMTLGGWGLGIGLVFFAPNIVGDIRNRASGLV